MDYLKTHAYLETARALVDNDNHRPSDSHGDGMDIEMKHEGGSLDADTLSGIEKRRSKSIYFDVNVSGERN